MFYCLLFPPAESNHRKPCLKEADCSTLYSINFHFFRAYSGCWRIRDLQPATCRPNNFNQHVVRWCNVRCIFSTGVPSLLGVILSPNLASPFLSFFLSFFLFFSFSFPPPLFFLAQLCVLVCFSTHADEQAFTLEVYTVVLRIKAGEFKSS